MLKTAFAAALLIGTASAAQAQTYSFSGLPGDTLTLSGTGVLSGTFTTAGGSIGALAFSTKYKGAGTIVASSIDLSAGNDYDVVFVIYGKNSKYVEYKEQLTTKKFKRIGAGTYTD
jgi:hypothetical protein